MILKILLPAFLFFLSANTFAQVPVISYQTPQVYTTNNPITPLSPVNTGGAVANNYIQQSYFAGSGEQGLVDGQGTAAEFYAPNSIAIDGNGNFIVSDQDNNAIRKVTSNGAVSTIVHNLSYPGGAAVDAAGNIYVGEYSYIEKIDPAGNETAFAGSKTEPGYINGSATDARFRGAFSIVIDAAGNLYVADFYNYTIRKITPAGVVSTFAGNGTQGQSNGPLGSAEFQAPYYLAIDAGGNIYVADQIMIRKVSPAGVVSTVAGNGVQQDVDGPASGASFYGAVSVAVSKNGDIYVGDQGPPETATVGNRIRKISNGIVSTLKVNDYPNAINTYIEAPAGIITDNAGNIYVTSSAFNWIIKLAFVSYTIDQALPPGLTFNNLTGTISGTPTTTWPSTNYTVTAYNSSGSNSTVLNITVNNLPVNTPLSPPNINYVTPQKYTVNNAITPLAPTNTGGAVPATVYGQVTTFAGSGGQGSTDGIGTAATFNSPIRSIQDPKTGALYVADRDNNLVRKVMPDGTVTTFAGGFYQPNDIALDSHGNLFVADAASNTIKEVTPAGIVTTFAGSGSAASNDGTATQAGFYYPYGITADANDNLYVADSQNSLIRKITPQAVVTTFAGSGNAAFADGTGTQASFNTPNNIRIDAASGNFYVGDVTRIRKISAAGVVTTIAGDAATGAVNGAALSATFNFPSSVVKDAAGNSYIGDVGNYLIRKIDKNGIVSTLAGNGTAGFADGVGTEAAFNGAYQTNVDISGTFLYVDDLHNNRLRKIMLTGYAIDKALPAGLTFDATTGIISGTPTVTSPAKNYTITAYNTGGSSFAIVTISVVNNISALVLNPIPDKTLCSADFDPEATGGSGAYTYSSSNTAVATIVNNKVHIVAAGTTTITVNDGSTTTSQQLTVKPPVIPGLIITQSPVSPCEGTIITFTAQPQNQGTNPTYQWQINNQPAGTNSPTFTPVTVQPNDIISCTLTNTTDCTNGPVTKQINAVVNIPATPTVTISSSATGPVPPGTGITFTPTLKNFTDVTLDWTVNNVVVSNDNTFNSSCLQNGDVVQCTVTNLVGGCITTTTAQSNTITVQIVSIKPTVTITQAPTGTVAQGTAVTFNATPVNGGDSPDYQWSVNGIGEGTDSPTFNTTCLDDGDVVQCELIKNGAGCVNTLTAFSNTIKVSVTDVPISVSITQLPVGTVIQGTTVTFTATPTSGGDNPVYEWTVNGLNTGVNSNTFSGACFNNGDIVQCILTKNGIDCIAAASASSNTLTVAVTASNPSVSVQSSATGPVLSSTSITFTATPTNAGSSPTYQWTVNGANAGTNNDTYTNTCFNNGDVVLCTLTKAADGCFAQVTVQSNPVTVDITADANPVSVTITPSANNVYTGTSVTFTALVSNGTAKTYQWMVNNKTVSTNATFSSNAFNNGDNVTCIITTDNTCNTTFTSNTLVMTVLPPASIIISNTFTPNGDGVNDLWQIPNLAYYPNCRVNVYNRYGGLVFQSKGYPNAWDGTCNGSPLPTGTYYYVIDPGNKTAKLSGYVAIIR